MNTKALTQDAGNRALRTIIVALVTAVFVDVWPIIHDALNGTDAVNLDELWKAVIRTAIMAAGSFFMRRVLDPSGVPTPLPPTDQSEPTTSDPAP